MHLFSFHLCLCYFPEGSCSCVSAFVMVAASFQDKGIPFWIGCHMSHQYQTGACLYFTFGGVQKDRLDLTHFLASKKAATEAILRNGGVRDFSSEAPLGNQVFE